MPEDTLSSKRLAKNTILLYFRMIVLMFISFFTSRVILDTLGVVDFGIQNVVGGLSSMFIFFRSSLANVTQRFLNIELGRNNIKGAEDVFRVHQTIYIIITIVVVLLAETLGVWIVYNKLVIPLERLNAAICVFHFTVISLALTILGVVYNSALIAHENMKVYSCIGVIEGICKLVNAYIICVVPWDRLIIYQFLLLLMSLFVWIFNLWYCKTRYAECTFRLKWSKERIYETVSMVGWNTLSTVVVSLNSSGINILFNMFFGPIVNAARGISDQVNMAINNFCSGFLISVNPQMTKAYAMKEFEYLYKLFFMSSKFGVFLLWAFCLPVILCIDTILGLWLKEVPEYTNVFTIWILFFSLVNMLNHPIWTLALAVGKLRNYVLFGSIVYGMVFPIGYLSLKFGNSPVRVLQYLVIIRAIYIVVVFQIVKRFIPISTKKYMSEVILPIIAVLSFSGTLGYCAYIMCPNGMIGSFVTIMFSLFAIAIGVWILGLSTNERGRIVEIVNNKFR